MRGCRFPHRPTTFRFLVSVLLCRSFLCRCRQRPNINLVEPRVNGANMTSTIVSRREISKTLFRSFIVATSLSIAVSYLLYAASPGLVIMEVCELLSIPSSLTVQYFAVKLHSAFFETIVNSIFYTLVVFAISLLYGEIRARRLRQPTEGSKAPL